jgi:hypothetical protein
MWRSYDPRVVIREELDAMRAHGMTLDPQLLLLARFHAHARAPR